MVFKLRFSALLYGIVFLCALWAVAYAVAGNFLRSFLFVGALLLANVVYGQFKRMTRSADILELMPFIKEFDEEMKKSNTVKKSNPRGHAYFDPETGEFKKNR